MIRITSTLFKHIQKSKT